MVVQQPAHPALTNTCLLLCEPRRDNEPEVRTAATSKLSAFARLVPVSDVTTQVGPCNLGVQVYPASANCWA